MLLDFMKLRDMIDGGGAGKSGPTFEGGGLLSEIANLIARPLGSDQQPPTPPGLGGMQPMAGFQAQPMLTPPQPSQPPAEPAVALPGSLAPSPVTVGALPPAADGVYSGRGNYGMPQPLTEDQEIARQVLAALGIKV